jgi:hypothetical protein
MIKLTKQAINRLFAAPVFVGLYGCFNKASVITTFSRYSVDLRVEVTHPLLQWQRGREDKVELIYWKGSDGFFIEVPPELEPLVEKLRKAATMTDEEAQRIGTEYAISAAEAMREFGLF